jgi:hypothetical protein
LLYFYPSLPNMARNFPLHYLWEFFEFPKTALKRKNLNHRPLPCHDQK